MSFTRHIIPVVLLLVGCQTYVPANKVPIYENTPEGRGQTASPPPGQPQYEPPSAEQPVSGQTNVGVLALLDKATLAESNADFRSAAASLERAIRISPRDADLYFRLARVRDKQGNLTQAAQLCRKAVALAVDGRYMELKCEALLEAN